MTKIAVIRIRGNIGVKGEVKDTLEMLHLKKKNNCIVKEESPSFNKMIHKVKDMVTFGEVDEAFHAELIEKRGKPYSGLKKSQNGKINYTSKYVESAGKQLKPYFTLNNPKGGFERKGIKTGFNAGGVLGYRGKEISTLIKKMM